MAVVERIRFTVPGVPVPKERPRRAPSGHWYTPKATRQYEHKVATHALQARRGRRSRGPYEVTIRLYFPDRRRRDADNVTKAIADALNGIVWSDDSEITRLVVEKDVDAENPRAVVEIRGVPR